MADHLGSISRGLAKIKPFKAKAEIKLPSKADIKKAGADNDKSRKAITQGTLRGSVIVERELPKQLDNSMQSSVWGPFSPKFPYYRKNGELVGAGTRDLIDMGTLHDSLSIKTTFLQTKVVMSIEYSAPYARFVHNGGAMQPYGNPNAPTRIIPARPWVTSTLVPGGPVPHYDYMTVYNTEIANAWKM